LSLIETSSFASPPHDGFAIFSVGLILLDSPSVVRALPLTDDGRLYETAGHELAERGADACSREDRVRLRTPPPAPKQARSSPARLAITTRRSCQPTDSTKPNARGSPGPSAASPFPRAP